MSEWGSAAEGMSKGERKGLKTAKNGKKRIKI